VRLLVVTQYFWPEDFRINELVAALVRRGHVVTVMTGKPNYPHGTVFPEFAANPTSFGTYEGARVIRLPMFARGQGRVRLILNYFTFALSASTVGVARVWESHVDAIFVFEPSPVTVGVPAVVLRALRGWPVAFWVLDQWPETLVAVGALRSGPLLRLLGRLVRWIYERCDVILSPSRLLVPRIRSYCRPDQRVEYFPNWTEAAYESSSQTPAPEVTLRPEGFHILFAGNIGEAQDFPTILAAAERLRHRSDIRWLILGDGRMAGWLRAEIERRNLAEHVVMLGRFPAERMPSFFLHASALLVSLRADPVFTMTAPGKIQSYLAAGRPVLAALDGEGATLIEEAGAGFASPAGDPVRLAQNVTRMAALSQGERARLGANGAAYAEREFNRDALVRRLEHWLREIAAGIQAQK
jgi:glycosyltransferase involved in cell wall biosynthesis